MIGMKTLSNYKIPLLTLTHGKKVIMIKRGQWKPLEFFLMVFKKYLIHPLNNLYWLPTLCQTLCSGHLLVNKTNKNFCLDAVKVLEEEHKLISEIHGMSGSAMEKINWVWGQGEGLLHFSHSQLGLELRDWGLLWRSWTSWGDQCKHRLRE